jgi:anti-sigma regulatory factor (Ser/Thr protein kinase)
MTGSMGAVTADYGSSSSPWPLQTRLDIGAQPTAPGVARGHVRAVACEWGLANLADTAELLASELTTNAVQASARLNVRTHAVAVPVIRLWVSSDGAALVIHVWDAHPDLPALKDPVADAENGRGLLLVSVLGKEWGAYRKAVGKVVWVMITQTDP